MPRPSLRFVRAINFELTYQCNRSCSHCLQQGVRETSHSQWINTDVVRKVLVEGLELGFISTGVNFTGGEPFLPESNLPELVEFAHSLGIQMRINTNGWWGRQNNLRIGEHQFQFANHVVKWLRKMKVTILALSFDQRFNGRPEQWQDTVAIIRECEKEGQPYQIICTGVQPCEMLQAHQRLVEVEGIDPRFMIPVNMEMVDLGGSAGRETEVESQSSFFCQGKGFYRPHYLHISPSGGVRSCLYAPDCSWLGIINQQSLSQVAEEFEDNVVVEIFSSQQTDRLHDEYSAIYSAAGYKLPNHPCAVSAVVARTIEAQNRFEVINSQKPSDNDWKKIVVAIAKEYGLQR